MSEPVGRISAVWRFPVKSMQGQALPEVSLTRLEWPWETARMRSSMSRPARW